MNELLNFIVRSAFTIIKRNGLFKYITIKNRKIEKDEQIGKYIDKIGGRYEVVEDCHLKGFFGACPHEHSVNEFGDRHLSTHYLTKNLLCALF